jgi:hypothetical protein
VILFCKKHNILRFSIDKADFIRYNEDNPSNKRQNRRSAVFCTPKTETIAQAHKKQEKDNNERKGEDRCIR